MRSMTGFGQAAAENESYRATLTIRGVNHRQLDLVLRLREEYRSSEIELRELLTAELSRGRIEVSVDIDPVEPPEVEVHLRVEVIRALQEAFEELARAGVATGELLARDLLQLPQAMELRLSPLVWAPEDHQLLLRVGKVAVEQVVTARDREGTLLKGIILSGLEKSTDVVQRLRSRRKEVQAETYQALEQRIAEILKGEAIDEVRMSQEVAILVERSDVSEELDRLAAHLQHFAGVLEQQGPIGRRLDFLAQEMFREWNTLSAKCRDPQMSRWALDGKVICEQLREQVQNVE